MYADYELIKETLQTEMTQRNESTLSEDTIQEIGDGFTPIYYADIIKDWQAMPSEYGDAWQELGELEHKGIMELMQIDLEFYYQAMTNNAYTELMEEAEAREHTNAN